MKSKLIEQVLSNLYLSVCQLQMTRLVSGGAPCVWILRSIATTAREWAAYATAYWVMPDNSNDFDWQIETVKPPNTAPSLSALPPNTPLMSKSQIGFYVTANTANFWILPYFRQSQVCGIGERVQQCLWVRNHNTPPSPEQRSHVGGHHSHMGRRSYRQRGTVIHIHPLYNKGKVLNYV